MLKFPARTLSLIKRLLLRQQRQIEGNLKEIEQDDPVKVEVLIESSEPGTDSYIADTHSKAVVLGEQLKATGKKIGIALNKIRLGTYGKCEKCGNQIEMGRLLVMPTAQYCILDSKKVSR